MDKLSVEKIEAILRREETMDVEAPFRCLPPGDKNWIDFKARQIISLIRQYIPEDKGISCPYCGEDDFDLLGLKHHLERYCKIYQETENG